MPTAVFSWESAPADGIKDIHSDRRRAWVAVVGLSLLFIPVAIQVLPRGNATDYEFHVALAERMSTTGVLETPHFLYQVATIGIRKALPFLSFVEAGRLVTWICSLATLAVVHSLLRDAIDERTDKRRSSMPLTNGTHWLPLLGFMLVIAGPISVFTFKNFYLGYLSGTPHHNPTYVMLRPLATIAFFGLIAQLYPSGALTGQRSFRLAFVSLAMAATVMTKPNFILIAAPAFAAIAAIRWRRESLARWTRIALPTLLPALALLAWQYYFEFARHSGDRAQAGIAFAPFKVLAAHTHPAWIAPKFLLSIAFPMALCFARPGLVRQRVELHAAWLAFAVGCFLAYGFQETGPRAIHGNFLWSAHIGVFLLMVASMRAALAASVGWSPWRDRLVWLAFGCQAACGLVYFLGFASGKAQGWWC